MKQLTKLLGVLPLLVLATPVLAQDLLRPFEDFVEQLTAPPPTQRRTPQPPPAAEPEQPESPPAEPPPVPRPRPEGLGDVVDENEPPAVVEEVEPEPEPPVEPAVEDTEPLEPDVVEEAAPAAEANPAAEPEPEPEPVPERIYQAACPAVIMGLVEADMLPPLSEGACGEQSPLSVTAVSVRGRMLELSTPLVTNCQMASALPGWLETVDGYAGAMLGSPLTSVLTGTSYMCRNRNGGDERFMSEHGFANAVDVVGFTLEDGRTIGVEADWLPAAEPEGRLLRLAHDAACSGFTTVLGPEANAEHQDHLHLDLGCHGQTCTARLCE